MKLLCVMIALCSCGFSQDTDPFAENPKVESNWPKRLAPAEKQLKNFGELNLSKDTKKGAFDVRFIWVPAFNKPFSIRATGDAEEAVLRVVRMKGNGGYEWGEIEIERNIKLSKKQVSSLLALVSVDGAREPSQEAKKELRANFVESFAGLDGSTWFLEVRNKDGYTVEGVPNPIIGDPVAKKALKENSGLDLEPFLAVCLELFKLSGLDGAPDY